ncbi:MAG TPA: hypothetical protein VF173_05315 [Thermoanaerobaculia bacterium]|nr:hypothetical protein [Thermoanaerobaculia bacterium]
MPGAFIHPNIKDFVRISLMLFRLQENINHPPVFRLIKTTGHTDGLENKGVCCWRDLVKAEKECAFVVPGVKPNSRLFEKELGLARACVARSALERALHDEFPIPPEDWRLNAEDIETGGSSGDPYRKVTLEIWIKDGCDYGKNQ